MADPNVGQRFYGNGVTVVNVVQIDVGTYRTYASQSPLAPSLACETVGRGRIRKWTRK